MALIVQKYGGTSVGDVERIQGVARRVARYKEAGHDVVVVVSAMSGETNRLMAMGQQIGGDKPLPRELDVLLSSGEQVTIALLSMALMQLGVSAKSLLGDQVAVHTDSAFGKARIERIDTQTLKADLDQGVVPVVAGFQGVNGDGDITTLGRGGSDTSAVALAAALHADECEICTDVDGVYTADPRIIKDARRLDQVTFEEMLELASLGSKVLHPRSVEFAGRYKVPLRVLSTFQEGPGTLITMEMDNMEQAIVSGIAHALDEAKITVAGVPDIPGVASKILGPIGRKNIEVDMILQNTGADGLTDFTFTVKRQDFAEALATLENMAKEFSAREISGDDAIAKVSIVGVGMRSHAGVATRMFDALAAENINIQMISTSEIKISVVVAERYMELAVRALHAEFELHDQEQSANV
ncbi:MAG: aspartate kinase [Pseudomonadota bacterium]|nr:aspartate kinase [Pseudomonadota bacterium]MEC7553253.1 aspartate kinase [Pseudomonadota bacterium]MEC7613771.1 aspartate kinase [Pseudomonadota bacterium]MEC7663668.1 aspartate kinase [Pseudomonadota bacterium]MEC8046612.1 aspartate kinase [Pseudomonadota bacterium]|tara:strand:+ start:155 stop:1393 length:1239 start_codon:yes stop_codon:yes gene_type:complete